MSVDSEVIVVGSGPAGAFAAWGLRGRSVRVLDPGHQSSVPNRLEEDLLSLRAHHDLTALAMGDHYDGLRHLRTKHPVSLKLRAPGLRFVIRDFERLAPFESATFPAVISLAKGGFGNVWGTGVYRFSAEDLDGFPISRSDLEPHYNEVSSHIGISGERDDLHDEFGEEPVLQPPLKLSQNAASLVTAYGKKRGALHSSGLQLGRARLAVLSEPYRGRTAYSYRGLEFLQAGDPAAYNPAMTIDELRSHGDIEYDSGWMVQRFREVENGVEVEATDTRGESTVFRAKRLVLAAGALNSARIVLASAREFSRELPLLDNPILGLPLIHAEAIGRTHQAGESTLAQLNFTLAPKRFGAKYQGSIYGSAHVPVTEWVNKLPLSMDANLRLLRYLLPACSLAMLFYPADPSPGQYVRLRADGVLEAASDWAPDESLAGRVASVFRRLGVWTWGFLGKHARPGQGMHYAGTLPMRASPGRFELDRNGRLAGHHRVFVCDGSCFPRLPAKNHTFTIMANAHRIAKVVASELV